jgi:uncharacterized protein YjbJ (UPF0337 family)
MHGVTLAVKAPPPLLLWTIAMSESARNAAPHPGYQRIPAIHKGTQMDKDRIEGAANHAKGAVKETGGKVTGDGKLQTEGTLDKAKGHVESAVGGAKDTLRGK